MRFSDAKRGLLLLIGLIVARWIVHFVLFRDGVAVLEIAGLDVGALFVLVLSFAFGPNVGRHIGSITLYFVVVLLAIAGIGYLAEVTRSKHLSLMSAFTSVLGAGAGLCLATTTWNQARWVMGLLAVAGGTYGLANIQQKLDALVIASPYVLASVVFVIVGMRSNAEPAATG